MLQKIKMGYLIFLSCFSLQASDQSIRTIETMGDIFQFLPAFSAGYALYTRDYEGLREFAIGFGTTMGIVLISKGLFQAISKKSPNSIYFAKRPNSANFQGFPSGHTASAFSAAGFLQKRYGWKLSLPAAILATFTGYSRIKAKKHTVFQVIAGAMLGFSTSYLSASKWLDPSKEKISFEAGKHYRFEYSRFF